MRYAFGNVPELFTLLQSPKRGYFLRILVALLQIILCLLALVGPILCIIVFDRSVVLPFEIVTEGLNGLRIICAYAFLIYYMRKPHLINLLSVAYHHEPKRIKRLGKHFC